MAVRRTLAALVAALMLPISTTAASICDLSCSLQVVDADCQMTPFPAADNAHNQATRFASPVMNMQSGMHMDSGDETGATTCADASMNQCPQCKDDICTQASILNSIVRSVSRIHFKNVQRMAVGSLDLILPSTRTDWIKHESPPPKIEISLLSPNLRI